MGKVTFHCDLAGKTTPFPHFWEHTVGSGHATLALRADWQKQLQKCHLDLGFRHVRFHGLLCDDMSTFIEHEGERVYSFVNTDRIFDFLVSSGMRPFVELSFMPTALASGDTTVLHYRANITPPKHYKQWAKLISKLISHWIQRYGVKEVRQWFFEVWNEPNLPNDFWKGTQEDYFKLYHDTAKAIINVDDSLQVGGPATAKNEWIDEFRDFCDQNNVPVRFISTHHYPTDAFGSASDDTVQQLARSRRSILREEAQETFHRAHGLPVYYTEWNTSSNPRDSMHDEPYAAAFIIKTVMEASGLMEGYSFWTFSDIFEEEYFHSEPFYGGFGLLNIYGIAKPSYRAYQLMHALGTERLLVDGLHNTVGAWVIKNERSITILLTNYALPLHPIDTEQISIVLENAQAPSAAFIERIDSTHANAKAIWLEMGSPEYLMESDVAHLEGASSLRKESHPLRYENGAIFLELTLPAQAVSAISLEFGTAQ